MLALKDYWMGRDITCAQELNEDIKKNAEKLISTVNLFLKEIGVSEVKISSGWRPSSINSKVPNAAKKSLHMSGLAVDLFDDGKIKEIILKNVDKLEKYNLWLESIDHTPTWVHLDLGIRSARPKRIFIP